MRFPMLQILSSFLSLILYLPFIYAQFQDTCNFVSSSLPIDSFEDDNVDISVCLCLDTIPDAIATNPALAAFAAYIGESLAEQILSDLVITGPGLGGMQGQTCHFPANAIEQCTFSNVCAYTCASGTTLCSDGSCSTSCPSAPAAARRDQLPMPTSAFRCPAHQEICRFGNSLKCVDTQTSLVSCGGCMHGRPSKRGKDCSEIPGVNAVSCLGGVCDVTSCMKGYTFNPDYRNCSLTATDVSS